MFSHKRKKRKDRNVEKVIPMDKKIIFEALLTDSDLLLTKLASYLLNGEPIIINLEKLTIDGANKTIAFLSGVVYAVDGVILQIEEKIFLFALPNVYEDGTVKAMLNEL